MNEQVNEGPQGWKLLNSALAQTTVKEATDTSGPPAGHPHQAKPSVSLETQHNPPPASGSSLGLLIWRWNARYPHWLPLGPRLHSSATATRRGPPSLQVGVGDACASSPGPRLDLPRGLGRGGERVQRQLRRECRARVAPRGTPWAQRVAPGVSD